MRTVNAPSGYEGTVYYVDATRSWQPAYRRTGDVFWTNTYLYAGHAHTPTEEVTERAERSIVHAIEFRKRA